VEECFTGDYSDWVKADVFVRLFKACSDEPDMEYAMVDATSLHFS